MDIVLGGVVVELICQISNYNPIIPYFPGRPKKKFEAVREKTPTGMRSDV